MDGVPVTSSSAQVLAPERHSARSDAAYADGMSCRYSTILTRGSVGADAITLTLPGTVANRHERFSAYAIDTLTPTGYAEAWSVGADAITRS